ncbi:hypothetical protein SCHPADRAFT_927295 [Schizopora paradoxa]|uniref:Uncharacterized protein n=1 Tax=Schizopora paradoxa TaxID=27342 RepID=A0A0H2RUI8_9AGAM|nr:hypothetical protein SCHPADRAFT_927295 [Schizopora paradoxa]
MDKRRRSGGGMNSQNDDVDPLPTPLVEREIYAKKPTNKGNDFGDCANNSPSFDNLISVNNWSAENGGLDLKRTYKNRNGRARYNRVILSYDADTPLLGNGGLETKPTKARTGHSSSPIEVTKKPLTELSNDSFRRAMKAYFRTMAKEWTLFKGNP